MVKMLNIFGITHSKIAFFAFMNLEHLIYSFFFFVLEVIIFFLHKNQHIQKYVPLNWVYIRYESDKYSQLWMIIYTKNN